MDLKGKYELLSDIVYNTIKEAIINGEMEAESKLSETKLAKELGVSRTPVREALRLLSAEGFVKLSPNSSFVVNSFSLEDAYEILEARRLLEGEAARLAALRITDKGRAVLDRQLEQITELEKDSPENTSRRFTETDVEFHRSIYSICGNSRLAGLGDMLQDKQARLHLAGDIAMHVQSHTFLSQHREIAEAIKAGDAKTAEKYAQKHIDFISGLIKRK